MAPDNMKNLGFQDLKKNQAASSTEREAGSESASKG